MLAALAMFIGIIAFAGFWVIRREATGAAEDAAVKEINRLNAQKQLNLGTGSEAADPRQPAQTIDFESAKEVRTDRDDDGS